MPENLKVHEYKDRQEYVDIQVARSRKKFDYCKVYLRDILRYRELIAWDYYRDGRSRSLRTTWRPGRILCLGVRSGAENDLFRLGFFSPLMRLGPLAQLAVRLDSTNNAHDKIRLARRFGLGAGGRNDGRVLGVEINPDAARTDIHVGSFDELPADWTGRFDLLFTNSFDHSMDPARTVAEWKRVAAPGAYAIVAFSLGQEQSDHDPVAGLSFQALSDLWGAPVVFATDLYNRNGYREICFRLE